jgi:hypothetical protein
MEIRRESTRLRGVELIDGGVPSDGADGAQRTYSFAKIGDKLQI